KTKGNQATLQMLATGLLRPKLRVNQPGDEFEQEADRVADHVMRLHAGEGLPPALPYLYREAATERQASGSPQRTAQPPSAAGGHSVPDEFLSGLGSGQSLDPATRSLFESQL